MKTEATARTRTPLAEIAVGAVVLLIPALFQPADKAIGCYLKAHPVFIDNLFFGISHLLCITSYTGFGSKVFQTQQTGSAGASKALILPLIWCLNNGNTMTKKLSFPPP
jgi:hypothetical protein